MPDVQEFTDQQPNQMFRAVQLYLDAHGLQGAHNLDVSLVHGGKQTYSLSDHAECIDMYKGNFFCCCKHMQCFVGCELRTCLPVGPRQQVTASRA